MALIISPLSANFPIYWHLYFPVPTSGDDLVSGLGQAMAERWTGHLDGSFHASQMWEQPGHIVTVLT